jgi:hypothetical protein
MLHAKELPPKIWDEALNYANYIQKISPHIFVKDRNPFEAWRRKKPKDTHFYIFVTET